MDYTQRIKNLDEQIKLYHTPKTKITSTLQPIDIKSTVYYKVKLTFGYTVLPGTNLEVLNCIWCKQPPKHFHRDDTPTTKCGCGAIVHCNALYCECEKEYIDSTSNRIISNVRKSVGIRIQVYTENQSSDRYSKENCVSDWNNTMMSLLTGMVKPSYYEPTLSNGLFGNPFEC
jgi:hypothetical protein